jgi:hypothetical protein
MQHWFSICEQFTPSYTEVHCIVDPVSKDPATVYQAGAWFRSVSQSDYVEGAPRIISPLHGRSVTRQLENTVFVEIKGTGWSWGGPRALESPKEDMVFGLYFDREAQREMAVSSVLRTLKQFSSTEVIGTATFCGDCHLPVIMKREAQPALLYTRCLCPVRVADLAYFSWEERRQAVELAASTRGWAPERYLFEFADVLGCSVAALHDHGGVNDTLEPSNVTLAGEITDCEWIYVPGIATPDGCHDVQLEARQGKELIYGTEVVTHLATYFREHAWPLHKSFLVAYRSNRQLRSSDPNLKLCDHLLESLGK